MVPLLASISCLILCCLLCRGPMCSISTIDRTDIETLPLRLPACLPRLPQGVGSGTPLHGPTKRNETKRPSKRPPMQHHHAGRDTANRPAGPRSLTRSDIASLRGGTPELHHHSECRGLDRPSANTPSDPKLPMSHAKSRCIVVHRRCFLSRLVSSLWPLRSCIHICACSCYPRTHGPTL